MSCDEDYSVSPSKIQEGFVISTDGEEDVLIEASQRCDTPLSCGQDTIPSILKETVENDLTEDEQGVCHQRHADPVSDSYLEHMARTCHPPNTLKRNRWAFNTFNSWAISRNNLSEGRESVESLFTMNSNTLSYWLSKFVCEVRKTDGSEYPPKSLLSLCMGIQGHIRVEKQTSLDLLRDEAFEQFRQVLDSRMKGLVRQGIGIQHKQAQVFPEEEEEMLWRKKLLGDYNPRVLLRSMLFLNGKHFALRSGNEHRSLRFHNSQITLVEGNPSYLEYKEDFSKCNQGGLKHLRVKPKVVRSYANNNSMRCHVTLYKKYMRLSPNQGRNNAFYLTPLQKFHDNLWYSKQPAGHNTLQRLVPTLCEEAGLKGHFTNHSLRATAATTLYRAGVDEQLIMEQTVHRSLSGVRSYKRSNDTMKMEVLDLLNLKRPKDDPTINATSAAATATTVAAAVMSPLTNMEQDDQVAKYNFVNCTFNMAK